MSRSKMSKVLNIAGGLGSVLLLLLWGTEAMAAQDLADIVKNVKDNVIEIGPLLSIAAYVVGVGFCIAGIVQFKAHKDNPAQVPLSKPMVYLGVGAALLFLPSLMTTAGETIFGGEQTGAKTGAELTEF